MLDIINMPGVQFIGFFRQIDPTSVQAVRIALISGLMFLVCVFLTAAADDRNWSTGVWLLLIGAMILCGCVAFASCLTGAITWGTKTYLKLRVDGEAESAMKLLREYKVIDMHGTEWVIEYDEPEDHKK